MKLLLMFALCVFSASTQADLWSDPLNRIDLESGGSATIGDTVVTCKAAKSVPACLIEYIPYGTTRSTDDNYVPYGRATLWVEGIPSSKQVFEGYGYSNGWATYSTFVQRSRADTIEKAVAACRDLQRRGNCICNY